MPQLFRNAKDVLEDMASIPQEDAIETEPQLLSELDQLSQIAEIELQGKNVNEILLSFND